MANEGSTKPTYSELEAENLRVRGLLQRQWMPVESATKTGEHILVKDEGCTFGLCGGKMQPWYAIVHYWGHPGEEGFYLTHGDRGDAVYFTHWRPIEGAESADIGKLDSAHESGKVNENDGSREPAEWEQNKAVSNLTTPSLGTELPSEGTDEEYARYEQYLYGWKAHEAGHKMMTFSGWAREERKLAGSAETGGEKA